MERDIPAFMDNLDKFMARSLDAFPWDLFPWAHSLNADDRRVFFLEILQAVHQRDMRQLAELLEDWQATAEALSNSKFIQAYQQPYDAENDVPWEQARGELDLSGDPKEGSA
jgi:hypothetical protein